MAFQMKELALMDYHGVGTEGYRKYHYTNTNGDDVSVANFFDGAADQLYDNDIITEGTTGERYLVADDGSGGITTTVIVAA